MVLDPKHRVEDEAEPEWAMATREGQIAGDSCLPVKLLSRKAQAAFARTKSSVSGILKGSLALLSRAPPQGPAARGPGRPRWKAVTWNSAVSQKDWGAAVAYTLQACMLAALRRTPSCY